MSLQEGGEAGRRVTPDWAVRTKPLAFAADAAGYGVLIRFFGRSMAMPVRFLSALLCRAIKRDAAQGWLVHPPPM
jgi:hypothetical protein